MARDAARECVQVARAKRMYQRTLTLWASDYLIFRALFKGSAVTPPAPWQAGPPLYPGERDAA